MHDVKIIPLENKVDEIQVYYLGEFVGAGAWTKPYDKDTAVKRIIETWVFDNEVHV